MKFRTAVADPPWKEVGGGKIKRGAQAHYPLMKTKDMPAVIRGSGLWNFEDDAHLYLWVTNNFLLDGLWVLDQLDFRYVTNIVWTKPNFGIGQYFRGKHEMMLFGVRGKGLDPSVCTDLRNIPTAFDWDYKRNAQGKIIHSGKPNESYEMIEARSKGPYLEMFAREARPNYTVWGNEV